MLTQLCEFASIAWERNERGTGDKCLLGVMKAVPERGFL
jgi:hypothetical protein